MPTLVDLLIERATQTPDSLAYAFQTYRPIAITEITWGELWRDAQSIAACAPPGLRDRPVLLFYRAGLDFYRAFYACLLLGAWPTAVQSHNPRRAGRAHALLEAASAATESHIVWTTSEFSSGLPAGYEVFASDLCPERDYVAQPSEIAYLQLTSGSTRTPRAVRMSHANIVWMAQTLTEEIGLSKDSTMVGWLPLFHDMGLMLSAWLPLICGGRAYTIDALDFLQRPLRWLENLSSHQATLTAAPNFALDLVLERMPEPAPEVDLSPLRGLYNGSETVNPSTCTRFVDRFGPLGFSLDAMRPCYGLAEATLLVSGCVPGKNRILEVDPLQLALGQVIPRKGGQKIASCGPPMAGTSVTIRDPATGQTVPEGCVGEITVCSPGVSPGYLDENFPDSQVATADLGFLWQGELYITGRLKEMLIFHGANHSPDEFEGPARSCSAAVEACAAFSVSGPAGEELVLMAEVSGKFRKGLAAELARAVTAATGFVPKDVCFVDPRALPRTTSGKLQRNLCRQSYLERSK